MSEVRYELKDPFKYAYKGDKPEAIFITISAPTFKQMERMTPIKQAFTAAISEIKDSVAVEAEAQEASQDSVTGQQVMQLMYNWSGDMAKVFVHAQELFKSGVALIDGETRLTTPLMQEMTMTDFEGLVGDYIANFIAPSLMDGQ
jgi:hypothetical protein